MNQQFNELLGRVFDEHREDLREALTREEYAQLRADFIFHMTDWIDDVDQLQKMRSQAETLSTDDAMTFLIGFLYHATAHIKAAGRLLVDHVPDPFEGNEADRILAKAATLLHESDAPREENIGA